MNDRLANLLAEARREVLQKHRSQIEEETAFKWAARAVETYKLFAETGLDRWFRDSEHYEDEAREHAALADNSGAVLRAVHEWMRRYIPPSG